MVSVVAFDGDDTLWHNESIFTMTQGRYRALLERYLDGPALDERLQANELRNLHLFGYGIKGFTLSMIETAIEASAGQVEAATIQSIIEYGKAMLQHPVELLEGVRATIEALHGRYRLMVITKGDLFDQESKLARSGLVELFWQIEIVSEKDQETYRRILRAHHIDPREFVMVGNSIKSDILPVLGLGAHAVHVPYHTTWIHERAKLDEASRKQVCTLVSLAELTEVLAALL